MKPPKPDNLRQVISLNDDLKLVRVKGKDLLDKIESAKSGKLDYLEKIGVYDARDLVEDFLIKDGFSRELAYKISRGHGTNIVIINSGIDIEHPQISHRFRKFKKGINYVDWTCDGRKHKINLGHDEKDVLDTVGHGTAVAGIIAGKYMGIVPDATLYVIKVGDENRHSEPLALLRGFGWILRNKRDINIINVSLGFSRIDYLIGKRLEEICKQTRSKVSWISASGNDYFGPSIPASFDDILSIGALCKTFLDKSYSKTCDFSNIWPTIDLCAPGEEMFTLDCRRHDDDYKEAYSLITGTSAAAPIVTGILALARAYLKAKYKKISPARLEKILLESTDKLDEIFKEKLNNKQIEELYGKMYGFNKINPNLGVSDYIKFTVGDGRINAVKFIENLYSIM